MKISHECIHCLARQAVEIAEEATSNVTMQEEIITSSFLFDFTNEGYDESLLWLHTIKSNVKSYVL